MSATDIRVLDFHIDNLGMAEALARIENLLAVRQAHQVITANALMLYSAQKDDKLKSVFDNASLVVPDSIGLLWAARILGHKLKERVAGIDLLYRLADISSRKGYSFYLLDEQGDDQRKY